MTRHAAIAARDLAKSFDGRPAVDGVDLDVAPGEVFGFLGPNGAGKTTTIRMLAALIAPTAGNAWIDGLAIGHADRAIRRRVGLLTETPGLYDHLSARANLAFFARLYGVGSADAATQIEYYLRRLDLWDRRDDRVAGFSKGMKQKVALARALLHRPAVVFLDEPTAGLDPESAQVVHQFVEEIRGAGRTIFLCTHNLDEAQRLCDRVAIFRRHIIRMGSPTELRRALYGRQVEIIVANPDTAGLMVAVQALPMCTAVSNGTPGCLLVTLQDIDTQVPALVTTLVGAGAQIRRVAEVEHSLQSAYLDLIRADDEVRA
ncbi:MAG TPA: ABC transporter ATP-binding protein [Chloroflexia bacterium]|nr:ABC transporter ATP-binding protein [Chloroflexia bacterium]